MPHQCTKCSEVYPDASEELLKGCKCGSRFFYYIRQEKYNELQDETNQIMEELEKADKDQIEKDIRELTGMTEKPDEPVILDLESVRVLKPGKFEIDIVKLFSKNNPLIYKLEEGKYVIDIAGSLGQNDGKKRVRFLEAVKNIKEPEEELEKNDEEDNIEKKNESNDIEID
jgi:predicted  nucleic acid-binding Zn-ribbon protein